MAKSRNIGRGNNTTNQPIVVNSGLRGKDKAKLNKLQKEELITTIIEWILNGVPKWKVKENILLHAPVELNDNDATELIRFAIARMEEISKQDAQVVINTHIELYEEIYKYFIKVGFVQGANKALKAKEKLSGLIKDKKEWVINQKKKTIVNKVVEYDTSRLNPEQKKLLEELYNKAK
jgi:hypothetical protein